MKSYNLLFIILFLSPFLSFSQSDITIGKPYPVVNARERNYFSHGNEILIVKCFDRNKIVLQKLNADKLTFIKEKMYDDMPDKYVIESISEYNKRFFVFYSIWDNVNEKEQLFYREIDFENCSFIGQGTLIIQVNGNVKEVESTSSFYNFEVMDKFNFFLSGDNSKLLIQYDVHLKGDCNCDSVGVNVFDVNLNPLWNKKIKLPYTRNYIDYSIDSEGNVYILSTVSFNNNTAEIELRKIKPNTSAINITPLNLANNFINKIRIYEGPNNNMICAGFYDNGDKQNNSNGIVLLKVDKENTVFDIVYYEIPLEVLNQYKSSKSKSKNKKGDEDDKAKFENLELREMLIEKDGSILLIGEQHYFTTETISYTDIHGKYHIDDIFVLHYNDILATKISSTGKLIWMKKLPKRQSSTTFREWLSYTYMKGNNCHYFLFLDNKENIDLAIDEVPTAQHSSAGEGFLTAYKIADESGAITKTNLLDIKKVNDMNIYQFTRNRILQISSDQFVFEAYKKNKEDVLIKVNLK